MRNVLGKLAACLKPSATDLADATGATPAAGATGGGAAPATAVRLDGAAPGIAALPEELKNLVALQLDPDSNKRLRLMSKSFAQVGAQRLTGLKIPARLMAQLPDMLAGLPAAHTVQIHQFTANFEQEVARLGLLDAASRERITSIDLNGMPKLYSISNATIGHLARLTHLKTLDLRSCWALTNAGLAPLRGLQHLETLKLDSARGINDVGLALLQGMSSLRSLRLAGIRASDAGIGHLAGLSRLEQLDLSEGRHITTNAAAHLQAMPNLRTLTFASCPISNTGMGHLAALTSVERLALVNCDGLTAADLEQHLHGMTQLKSLDLNYSLCGIDTEIPAFGTMANLEALSVLGYQGLTDALLGRLAALPRLQSLNIVDCRRITDAGLAQLQDMAQLRVLKLFGCGASAQTIDALRANNVDVITSGRFDNMFDLVTPGR